MNFRQWLEASYTPADVPTYFYCVCRLNLPQLENGMLYGLDGISSDPYIIDQLLGEEGRSVILVIPSKELLEINKLTRIMYDNPNYLLSNDADAFDRIRDNGGSLRDVIKLTLNKLDIKVNNNSIFNKIMGQIGIVRSVRNLAMQIHAALKSQNKLPEGMSPEVFIVPLTNFLKSIGTSYEPEAEWRVKPEWIRIEKEIQKMRVLRIPKNTIIYIAQDLLNQDDLMKVANSSLNFRYRVKYMDEEQIPTASWELAS